MLILFLLLSYRSFAQHPPRDTDIIKKDSKMDTVSTPKKLEGGALIDTINTQKNKIHPQQSDSINAAPRKETRRLKDSH